MLLEFIRMVMVTGLARLCEIKPSVPCFKYCFVSRYTCRGLRLRSAAASMPEIRLSITFLMMLIQYISISAIVSNMAQLDTWINYDQVYQNVTYLNC